MTIFKISRNPIIEELARLLIKFDKQMISQHTKNYDFQRAEIERIQSNVCANGIFEVKLGKIHLPEASICQSV